MNPYFYIAKNPKKKKTRKPYKEPTQKEFNRMKELLGTKLTRGYPSIDTLEKLIAHSKKQYEKDEPTKTITKSVEIHSKEDRKTIEQRDDFIRWSPQY